MAEIHFDITSDTSELVSALNDSTRRLEAFSSLMQDLGDAGLDMSNPVAQIKSLEFAIEENEKVISDYTEQINELQQAQQQAALAGDTEKVKEIGDEIEELGKKTAEVADETNQLKSAYVELSGQMQESQGIMVKLLGGTEKYKQIMDGLPDVLKGAVSGLNKMVGAAKAFIATPLGAVLAALVLAYKALSTWLNKTAEGQQVLAKISGYFKGLLAGLEQIVKNVGRALYDAFTKPKEAIKGFGNLLKEQIVNRIVAMGGIFKNLGKIISDVFTGKFKDIGDDLKELGKSAAQFATGVESDKLIEGIKGINDIAKAESALNARRNKLHRDQMAWATEEKKLDAQIAEQRNKMYSGSAAERAAATAKAEELINKKYERKIELAKEEYNIRKESNALTESSQEELDEETRLEANMIGLQAERQNALAMFTRRGASASAALINTQAQVQDELNSLVINNTERRLALEKDADKKELELIEADYQKKMEAVRKLEAKFKSQNKELSGSEELTDEQSAAINEAKGLAEDEKANKIEERNKRIRNAELQFLADYGNFKERELAITEMYDSKIEEAATEAEKNRLRREKSRALAGLGTDYYKEFGTLEQRYTALITQWQEKIANLPEEFRDSAQNAMGDSLAALVEEFINKGDDIDLTRWARTIASKSVSAIQSELGSLMARQLALKSEGADDNDDRIVKLQAQIDWLLKKLKEEGKEVEGQPMEWDKLMAVLNDAADAFNELGDLVGGARGEMLKLGGAFLTGGIQIANAVKAIGDSTKALETATGILALVSAAIKVISKIANIANENEEATKAATKATEDYKRALQGVADEQARVASSNIFGDDETARIKTNIDIMADAVKGYGDAIQKYWSKDAIINAYATRGAVTKEMLRDYSNVSLMSDMRSGWQKFWGSGKNQQKTSLADFFDEDGKLKLDELKAYYDSFAEGLSDGQKELVENLIAEGERYENAVTEINDYIKTLVGDTADDVADKMIDAFEQTGDSLTDLSDLADEFGRNLAKAQVKALLMREVFNDTAQEKLSSLLQSGAVSDAVNYYKGLLEKASAYAPTINGFLSQIGSSTSSTLSDQQSTARGFQTMSEETAGELNGRFAALQISNDAISRSAQDSAAYLLSISDLVGIGNGTLSDIRNLHTLELAYLEDIARYTKPVLGFGDILQRIENNTSRL